MDGFHEDYDWGKATRMDLSDRAKSTIALFALAAVVGLSVLAITSGRPNVIPVLLDKLKR